MLREAFDRWRAFGTLDPPVGGELDLWLEEIRQRRVSAPSWLRAVLGALGLNWPAMAD